MTTLRPLLVTADAVALDDLLRLASTAGVEVDVAHDAGAARRSWATAPLVVVGADQLEGVRRVGLPRRSSVVVLGDDLDDAGVWQQAVGVGAEHVLFLPDAEPWLVEALADAAEGQTGSAQVVAVLGGRGGAGATTLACGLALAGERRGLQTLLVDGDRLGGGIDLVFGGEDASGLRWPDLGGTRGRLPASALAAALPRLSGLTVLSWDRASPADLPAAATTAVLSAGRRTHELVVLDLPRRLDDLSRPALAEAGTALLVVPADVRGVAAAGRVAAGAAELCDDLRLVVRTPGPAGLTGAEVARALGLPLLGELRPEPGLDLALERGEPPRRAKGPLGQLCDGLLDELVAAPVLRRAA